MDEAVMVLRMTERIIAVLIGGFSIYLGYRLFFHLPFEKSHEGTLELPGVKIVLSRVGPGIFFGVFGTLVMYYSLTTPVEIDNEGTFIGATARTDSPPGVPFNDTATPQQRSKALTSIQMLNCADRLLRKESNSDLTDNISLALRDARRALLLSVWNSDDWGPVEHLAISGPTDAAPLELRTRFIEVYEDCPR